MWGWPFNPFTAEIFFMPGLHSLPGVSFMFVLLKSMFVLCKHALHLLSEIYPTRSMRLFDFSLDGMTCPQQFFSHEFTRELRGVR